MLVFIVIWSDSFGELIIEKVFNSEQKANEYKGEKYGRWVMKKEVH